MQWFEVSAEEARHGLLQVLAAGEVEVVEVSVLHDQSVAEVEPLTHLLLHQGVDRRPEVHRPLQSG